MAQKAPIAPVQVRWRRLSLAETDASDLASAACYRRSERIGVATVVIAELKFGNVQQHIFGAHLVECADNTALEQRPEALNRVGVNRANNVLLSLVVNHLVRVVAQIVAIAGPLVRRQQADFVRNGFIHEVEHGLRSDAIKNAGDDVTCRSTAPMIGVLPARGPLRLFQWRFLSLPPIQVSSISTMPPSFCSGAISAARIL